MSASPETGLRVRRRVMWACLLTLVLFEGVNANGNGPSKAVERPVGRGVSTARARDLTPGPRARLTTPPQAKSADAHATVTEPETYEMTSDERRAFDLINAERGRRGLGPLALDHTLMSMARKHSEVMAEGGLLSHSAGTGLDLAGRARLRGLRGWKALGENIAYNQGYEDPTALAVERWMASGKHRDNILNAEFTHAGLGISRAADGSVFFTNIFMRR